MMQAPYIGLRPYEEADQDKFFGRDMERQILIDKILTHKLTLLFAASGVGKSSLLQAAVIPQLKHTQGENLDVVYHKNWFAQPLHDLKTTLINYLQQQHKLSADDSIDTELLLFEFCQQCTLFTNEPLVIILDQFEEFFNYQRYSNVFNPFIRQLAETIVNREINTTFVISMREDFALELNAFKPYLPTLLFENFYRLEKLTHTSAYQAVKLPLEQVGFQYETGLLETLITDLSQREQIDRFGLSAAALMEAPTLVEPPHLQIVCQQLWEHARNNPQKLLTQATYERGGKAIGLLKNYFLKQINQLSLTERKLASLAFDYLVNKHGTKVAYPLGDLAKLLRIDEATLGKTLDKLEQARILRRQIRQEVMWYELYHDIFSRSIYDWNEAYKMRQRIKKVLTTVSVVLVSGICLYVAYDAWLNYSHYHVRLNIKRGISDTIELYQGDKESLDIFQQQQYLYETDYYRAQIEADKLFTDKPVAEVDILNVELIKQVSASERLLKYWENGNFLEKSFMELVDQSLRDREPYSQIVKTLAELRSVKIIKKLGTYLKPDKSTEFRKQIITELGKTRAPTLVIPLLFPSLTDKNKSIRSSVVEALGQLDSLEAVEPLIKLIEEEKNPDVLSSAAKVLGQLGSDKAVQHLVKLLEDVSWQVRKNAVEALGKLNATQATNLLIERLTDSDSDVRESAVAALIKLNDARSINRFIELLKNSSLDVRDSVTEVLVQFDSVITVQSLIDLLNEPNLASDIRSSVAQVLGRLDNVNAIQPLIQLLSDPNLDLETRQSAKNALISLKHVAAVQPLIELLNNPKPVVRSSAAEILGQLDSMEAIQPLVELFDDVKPDVRSSAVAAIGGLSDVESIQPLVELLKSSKHSDIRIRAAAALSQLANDESLKPLVEANAVEPLIKLLEAPESYIRRSVVEVLGQLGSSKAIDPLLKRLDDRYPEVRSSTVNALTQIGNLKVMGTLFARFQKDQEYGDFKDSVPYALQELIINKLINDIDDLGDQSTIKLLIKILKEKDLGEGTRSNAARALGALGAVEGIDPLIKVLKDQEWLVRYRAVAALEELGNINAVQALIEITDDSDWYVQYAVISALARLGRSSEKTEIKIIEHLLRIFEEQNWYTRFNTAYYFSLRMNELIKKHLLTMFTRPDLGIQLSAEFVLGELSNADASNLLLEVLHELSWALGDRIIEAFTELGSIEIVRLLFDLLKDEDWTVRAIAAEILGQLNSTKAVKPLIELLEDDDGDVRQSVVLALGELSNIEAIKALLKILTDTPIFYDYVEEESYVEKETEEENFKDIIISALGKFDNNKIEKQSLELLHGPDWKVRSGAAEWLGHLGNAKSVKPLIELLGDRNWHVRKSTVSALGELGHLDAVNPLINMLNDEVSSVRISAIEALAQLGHSQAIIPLIAMLNDPDWQIRQAVVIALAQLNNPQAIEPLLERLNDIDVRVRSHVIEALGQLGHTEIVDFLIDMLNAPDLRLRKSAAIALSELKVIKAKPLLMEQLNNKNTEFRLSIARALGNLGEINPLVELLKDKNRKMRNEAATVLGQLGHLNAIAPLVKLLNENKNPEIRSDVITVLGQLNSSVVEKHLVDMLKDNNDEVRNEAALALSQLGSIEAVRPLVKQFKHLFDDIRKNAKTELTKLGLIQPKLHQIKQEIERFARKATHPNVEKRKQVAERLGEIVLKESAELLINLLNDADHEVKIAAIKSLRRLGRIRPHWTIPRYSPLQQLQQDSHVQVRQAAQWALEIITPTAPVRNVPLEQLKTIALDLQEDLKTRLSAIKLLSKWDKLDTINPIIEIIKPITNQPCAQGQFGESADDNILAFLGYRALGYVHNTNTVSTVLPFLSQQLQQLDSCKRQWRNQRDSGAKKIQRWRYSHWEMELGYAIAKMAPTQQSVSDLSPSKITTGIELLAHNLANVRKGAWLGVGKRGNIEIVEELINQRSQNKATHFHHATYRAIDKSLINVEYYGSPADLQQLENIESKLAKTDAAIRDRIQWTRKQLDYRLSQ